MPFLQTIGGGTAQGYRAPTVSSGAAASGGASNARERDSEGGRARASSSGSSRASLK